MAKLMKSRRKGMPILFFLSLALMLGSLGLLVYHLVNFTLRESQIPLGISVAGVLVGGMPEDQARAAVEEAYYVKPVTLYYKDEPINLNPNVVGFRLSTSSIFADVAAVGEEGGGFWQRFINYLLGADETVVRDIPLNEGYVTYQETALRAELENIAKRYDRPGEDTGFDVQTLSVFGGGDGYVMDVDASMPLVEQALRRSTNRSVTLPLVEGQGQTATLRSLERLIRAYFDATGFIYDGQSSVASVYIQDLTTGEEINIQGDVAFTAASTAKVAILVDYFRKIAREPSQDDAWLMANSILCSSNSTSNLIMSDILGDKDIFKGLQDVITMLQKLGIRNSYLNAPFVDGSDQQLGSVQAPPTQPNPNFNTDPDPFNQVTAEDLGTMFALIYDCAYNQSGLMAIYPDGEFTPKECSRMLELMSGLELNRLIQGGIPAGTRFAQKNGWFGEVTGNAGIVFSPNGHNYVISVFIWEDTAEDFQNYNRTWPIVEDISRAAWNFFNPDAIMLTPRTDLPPVAQECVKTDNAGNRINVYLPPYGEVNLDDIDGWKTGAPPAS
jgi:beta-lactamase class A